MHVGPAHHRHGEDAFSGAAKRVQHQEHASRWGSHMAGRMSRSLAEGDATGPLPTTDTLLGKRERACKKWWCSELY